MNESDYTIKDITAKISDLVVEYERVMGKKPECIRLPEWAFQQLKREQGNIFSTNDNSNIMFNGINLIVIGEKTWA